MVWWWTSPPPILTNDITMNTENGIPSVFDGAGEIENVVSKESVDKLKQRVAETNNYAITGEMPTYAARVSKRTLSRDYAKTGRNEPCPCGSGKKYKNCCLRSGRYEGLSSANN